MTSSKEDTALNRHTQWPVTIFHQNNPATVPLPAVPPPAVPPPTIPPPTIPPPTIPPPSIPEEEESPIAEDDDAWETVDVHEAATVPKPNAQLASGTSTLHTGFREKYKLFVQLSHGGDLTLAHRHNSTDYLHPNLVGVLRQSDAKYNEKLMLKLLHNHHENTTRLIEVFHEDVFFYLVVEVLDISLMEIISSPAKIKEPEAALIVCEVVKAIKFLANLGIEHTQVQASSILLGRNGCIKLGAIHRCQLAKGQSLGVLGKLVYHMLQRSEFRDSVIRIADLSLVSWSGAVKHFIVNSFWAKSLEVQTEPFLQMAVRTSSVAQLAIVGILSARREWSFWEG
ncbi:hypothetical protein AOL_s00091g15 [Orbilia oligospora ATCC 24927]|uniref:Protein kinase domain-containing protein n=1 Tax=Arthrobotrys oligospora (strain ATCC 24927 / CBS 115.81 / DSM 1491) TaxID=756982 RepID=G1XHW3_ARTOA|nr:hypothetical protein AOL_s00091g15 [Orbilia oligospora ATCC 24927]EGX47271.1 hypothetical protein AOL_s00091g15 [Orbilia oligospora ATCC 24927]